VVDVSGAGILKSSKNKADAQKFLAFVVSKQGQDLIAHSISYEYPLDDGVTTVAPETPFAEISIDWRCPDCGTDKGMFRPYVALSAASPVIRSSDQSR